MNQPAQQGHRYLYTGYNGNAEVLAMNGGKVVKVRPIIETDLGLIDMGPAITTFIDHLEPLPMRYLQGAMK